MGVERDFNTPSLGFVLNLCMLLSEPEACCKTMHFRRSISVLNSKRKGAHFDMKCSSHNNGIQPGDISAKLEGSSLNLPADCPVAFPPIKVVYEDRDIVVVSKPGGMLVHRSKEATRDTVFLLQTLRNQLGGRQVPYHRGEFSESRFWARHQMPPTTRPPRSAPPVL